MLDWLSPLGELGPAPDGGSLKVEVRCRARKGRGGRTHEVTIGPDWSVDTPHDLEAERVGVALGGYLSCVDLADHTVPALRDLLQLVGRRVLPPLGRNHAGRWVVEQPTTGCSCGRDSYATPYEAGEHVRSPRHLAPRYGADARNLEALVVAAESAHGGFEMCPPPGWPALSWVREPRGLDVLWGAGVPPEFVIEVQEAVLPTGLPLPTAAYLGAAFRCDDLAWLAATVARRPDPDVAVWAAWGYGDGDRAHPQARGDWLEIGVPRPVVDALLAGGVTPRMAEELAMTTGRTVSRAAQVLAAWERAGCRPGPGDIAALDVMGLGDDYEPKAATVDALHRRTLGLRIRPTRTQVAMLLGLAGNRTDALALLKRGVVTTADAMATLAGVTSWDSPTEAPAEPEDRPR